MERLAADELRELSARARAGDVGARNAIVESHMDRGVRMGVRMRRRMDHVRDAMMDADDFVQAAFLGLVRAVDAFDPDVNDDLDGWVGWHMRNAAIDAMKSIYRDAQRQALAARPEADPADSEAAVDRRDYIDWLETHLPDRQRAVVRMRLRDELSPPEIRERLGVSIESVHTYYSNAVARMRRAVDSDPDGPAALAGLVA